MRTQQETLLTRQQAADFLGIKPQTLATWAMTGKHVPFIKVGRCARYRQSDLEKFIEKQTVPASS